MRKIWFAVIAGYIVVFLIVGPGFYYAGLSQSGVEFRTTTATHTVIQTTTVTTPSVTKTVTAPPLTTTVTSPPVTTTTTVTVAPQTTPPPTSGAWRRIETFGGDSSGTTSLFEIKGAKFRLIWELGGVDPAKTTFFLFVYREGEGPKYGKKIGEIGGAYVAMDNYDGIGNSGTIVVEGSGRFYILVNAGSLSLWKVVVEDFY